MPATPPPVRPSPSRRFWALAVAAYVPVVVLLTIVVLQLEDTRSTVDGRVAASVERLRQATLPLADAVTPAARAANADRPTSRRVASSTLALNRELVPLGRELRASGAPRQLELVGALASDLTDDAAGTQLRRAGALATDLLGHRAGQEIEQNGRLARTLLRADVGGAVGDVGALADGVERADLPALARSLRATTDELNRGTRLERLLVRMTAVFGQAQRTRVVPRTAAAAEDVRTRLVPLVERGVRLLEEQLAVTRDTNRHTANIDRKLGGDLPLP